MSTALGPNAHLIGMAGSRERLNTPVLLLDLDALERNIAAMADFARMHGIGLRPHAKTHKSVEIARRQIAAGARGICCATLGEAEAIAGAGIPGVLITSPVVQPDKIARLTALNTRAEGLMAVVDDPANVAALAAAAEAAGKPLTLLIDVEVGSRRTGVHSAQAATALARQIASSPALRFAGIQGYAGNLQHKYDYTERREAATEVTGWLRRVADALAAEGLAPEIVTGGGTGTHEIDARAGLMTELEVGSYVVMDVDYGAVALREDDPRPFADALFVRTSVVGAAHEAFAVTDGGLKAFATDAPSPPRIARGAPEGATYGFAGDEHGRVFYPDGGAGAPRLAIGDAVECVTPHCDPTVNLYDHYHVVRGDTLVAIWPVDARGKR
ncbi:MAG: DSD1 family PLP-dependent enzyme [Alphaproteobacteria bacterium]